MKADALHPFLARELAHARARFRLDNALGTHHGISWQDFVLLELLDEEGVPEARLAAALGILRSQLLLRVRPLEKLGWVRRTPDGVKLTQLSAAGRRLLCEARETAASVCAQLSLADPATRQPVT